MDRKSENLLWIALGIFVVVFSLIIIASVAVEVTSGEGSKIGQVVDAEAVGVKQRCSYPQVVELTFYTPDQVNGRCLGTQLPYRVEVLCSNADKTIMYWYVGAYVYYPTYSIVKCPTALPWADAWRMYALV